VGLAVAAELLSRPVAADDLALRGIGRALANSDPGAVGGALVLTHFGDPW
jgi:hypothetical protein